MNIAGRLGNEQLISLLEKKLPDCSVKVVGEEGHFEVILVGECFKGLPKLKRQQLVYKQINDKITSGAIHAVTIHAYTAQEYADLG